MVTKIFDYHEFKENGSKWWWQRPTAGSSYVATQTGYIYSSGNNVNIGWYKIYPIHWHRMTVIFTLFLYGTLAHLGALSWTCHSWKHRNFHWNFDAIYRSSRDTSTSGLGGHFAISGRRLLSQSFENTFLSWRLSESYTLWIQLQQYLFWMWFVVLFNMNHEIL